MKKKWILLGTVCMILLIGSIGYLFKEKKEDAEAVTLVEHRTVPFGEEVYVSDFIQEIKGTITDNARIDTTSIGEKEVTVTYINYNNKKKQMIYTIEVIDEEAPIIMLGDSYTVKVGYQKELTNVIFSGDNCDDNPIRKIEGDYDLNEIGSYPLTFIVTDASGNETKKDFVLNVVENEENESNTAEEKQFADILENYKTENTKIGIDVSKWQEEIDWQKVKEDGVEFVILRIGYQDGIKGENRIDPYFYQNIQEAKQAGIPVGVYFYSYASTNEEAEEQAAWIVKHLNDYTLELPIAFDWENWTSFANFEISFYKLNDIANTFLKKIEENGYTPTLYSSKTYLEKIWINKRYKTWLAHYTNHTNYTEEYYMWQMCETGRVDGINTDVDINIMYE